jgi:hypothetical protein
MGKTWHGWFHLFKSNPTRFISILQQLEGRCVQITASTLKACGKLPQFACALLLTDMEREKWQPNSVANWAQKTMRKVFIKYHVLHPQNPYVHADKRMHILPSIIPLQGRTKW